MTYTIAIYLYDQAEALDFAGPYEVFTTASRVFLRTQPNQAPPFKVITIAKNKQAITARAGMQVLPEFSLEQHPAIDVLVIPGGVVDQERLDDELITWIQKVSQTTHITASVCTGAFLLAQAGLLTNKKATTHWEDIADLRQQFPEVEVEEHVRWVDQDQIISSAGIAAGIDMSLHIVERLAGFELAMTTARQMDVVFAGHR
jgi:transcriptional regulator GlxA family with amidase domain